MIDGSFSTVLVLITAARKRTKDCQNVKLGGDPRLGSRTSGGTPARGTYLIQTI